MAQPQKKLRVGIIGCGNVAVQRHLPMLRSLKSAEIAALADSDKERLEQAAGRFRIERSFTNYKELLSDPSVEAVGILVPLEHHFEIAMAALKANKHILLEKPLTMTMSEADRLIEEASRTDRKVLMGFNKRWHRRTQRARKIIAARKLGPIRLVNVVCSSGLDHETTPAWRVKRARGGGNFIEKGAHYYDLCRFLLRDDIREVYAVSASRENGDDEPAIVTARTSGGIFLNLVFSDFLPSRNEIEIFGEDCALGFSLHRFDAFELIASDTHSGDFSTRLRSLARFFKELPAGLLQYRYGGDYTAAFRAQWKHLIDCIQNDDPVECTLKDGRYALRITLAVLESAAAGRPVKIAATT